MPPVIRPAHALRPVAPGSGKWFCINERRAQSKFDLQHASKSTKLELLGLKNAVHRVHKVTNFSTGRHCRFEVGAGKQMLRVPSRGLLGTALLLSFFNPTRCATKTDGGMHFSLKNALTSLVASTRPTLCRIDAACAGGLATNNSEDHCGQKNAWVCLRLWPPTVLMTQPKKHQYERKQQCRQQTHASLPPAKIFTGNAAVGTAILWRRSFPWSFSVSFDRSCFGAAFSIWIWKSPWPTP